MFKFTPPPTTLYVAVNAEGVIANGEDYRNLGPAFSMSDMKVGIGIDLQYALHIDENGFKQGAFDITGLTLVNAKRFAERYCEKHSIQVATCEWIEQNNYRNTYEVVDTNGVEYHFHISRAYNEYSRVDCGFVYVSVKHNGEIYTGENLDQI